MTLSELADRIAALDAEATPGPWIRWASHASVHGGPAKMNTPACLSGAREDIADFDRDDECERQKDNADLTVLLRNHAAVLAEALRLCADADCLMIHRPVSHEGYACPDEFDEPCDCGVGDWNVRYRALCEEVSRE